MPSDLAIRIRQNLAFLTAVALFCVIYLSYHLAHPKGFSSAVLVANSDEEFVAIARALASEPLLILADEPTGNLASVQS